MLVMSQSINEKFGAPTLLCLQTRKCPTLLKQLCLELSANMLLLFTEMQTKRACWHLSENFWPTKGMRPDRPADKLTANKYGG